MVIGSSTLLMQRGFAYQFHTKPGGHDWGDWNAQISGVLLELAHASPRTLNAVALLNDLQARFCCGQ